MKRRYRIAINRAVSRRMKLEEKQKKADWKTGRESHVITMSPFAWHNVFEICKTENISKGQFFENMMIGFMEWYKTEFFKREFAGARSFELIEKGILGAFSEVLLAEYFKQKMDYRKTYNYFLDLNSMPDFSEFSENKKPVSINIEAGALSYLESALIKKGNEINIIDAIETAIFDFANNLDSTTEKAVNPVQERKNPTKNGIKTIFIK